MNNKFHQWHENKTGYATTILHSRPPNIVHNTNKMWCEFNTFCSSCKLNDSRFYFIGSGIPVHVEPYRYTVPMQPIPVHTGITAAYRQPSSERILIWVSDAQVNDYDTNFR